MSVAWVLLAAPLGYLVSLQGREATVTAVGHVVLPVALACWLCNGSVFASVSSQP